MRIKKRKQTEDIEMRYKKISAKKVYLKNNKYYFSVERTILHPIKNNGLTCFRHSWILHSNAIQKIKKIFQQETTISEIKQKQLTKTVLCRYLVNVMYQNEMPINKYTIDVIFRKVFNSTVGEDIIRRATKGYRRFQKGNLTFYAI